MPLSRNATIHDADNDSAQPLLMNYFDAVTQLLTADHGDALARAVSMQTGHNCHADEINAASITLEKHGAFYHPASVKVTTPHVTTTFVVNVAVSKEGQKIIDREFDLLNTIDPSTAGSDRVTPAGYYLRRDNNRNWPMYLGQWFDGFYEFHITTPVDGDNDPLVVWSPEPLHITQTPKKEALCHQIAKILTRFYNPLTFEQIDPWHHAAGDFIVNVRPSAISAKLITIRGYRSLIMAPDDTTVADILDGMLLFFLQLSVRMRLDRIDGTGDLVWAGKWAVTGVVNGFFDALLEIENIDHLFPMGLGAALGFFLAQLPHQKLNEALLTILSTYPDTTPEHHLIHQHLSEHLRDLHTALAPLISPFRSYIP